MSKCGVKEGLFVEPCKALESVIDNHAPGFSRVKGVFHLILTNLNIGKPSRSYIGVKSKNHKNGVLFNFCPFCGVDISEPFMKKDEKKHEQS